MSTNSGGEFFYRMFLLLMYSLFATVVVSILRPDLTLFSRLVATGALVALRTFK